MGHYSSLCVLSTLIALIGNIIPASSTGGNTSSGSGCKAAVKNAISAIGEGLKAMVRSTWQDVVYSELEDEKGVLKSVVERGPHGDRLWFKFYSAHSLGKKGDTSTVRPKESFACTDITWVSQSGEVVQFKRGSEKVYSFKFKSDKDARAFVKQQAQLKI